jgi:hypothetical protein
MTDFGSIVTALDALKHATEILRLLRSADSVYEKAELKMKIAELAEAVATARLSVIEAQSEIQALKNQIARTSEEARAKVVKREGVYFMTEEGEESGPFCPRCFEADGRRMPLTRFTGAFTTFGKYNCPQCKATY